MLQADAIRGAGDRLSLFPGAGQVVLTFALTRRHTHSIIIRNTPAPVSMCGSMAPKSRPAPRIRSEPAAARCCS